MKLTSFISYIADFFKTITYCYGVINYFSKFIFWNLIDFTYHHKKNLLNKRFIIFINHQARVPGFAPGFTDSKSYAFREHRVTVTPHPYIYHAFLISPQRASFHLPVRKPRRALTYPLPHQR